MFCYKCGAKVVDGAEFCQKCGAKLIVDASTGQSAAASRANPPQQSSPSLSNTSEKKKSNLPIVLGLAAALILVLVIMAATGNKGASGSDVIAGNSHVPSEVDTQSAEVSSSTPTDSLLFRGTPIQDIIGAHSSDIIAVFGEPETQSEYSIEYGEGFREDGWMGFYFDDADQVYIFNADPVHFTFEGQSLVQDFDTLVTIFGDDYTDVGGTAYYWQVFWNYRDYQIYFSFSRDSDDDKPYSIDVMKSDSETPADDDDYSWVPGDIDDSLLRDQALVGRWRSYDGGSVEFDEYGNAAVSFRPNASILPPDYITWEASNGQIVLSSRFSDTYRWDLSERGSMQYLTLSTLTSTIYARSESDTSLVGTWDEIGDGYRNTDALVLYADGTGTINKVVSSATWAREIIPITWWTDDTNFNYEWTTRSAYNYTVSGNILTIYFSNGSQIYTKVGD